MRRFKGDDLFGVLIGGFAKTLSDEQMSAYLKLEAQYNFLHVIELDQIVEFTVKFILNLKNLKP